MRQWAGLWNISRAVLATICLCSCAPPLRQGQGAMAPQEPAQAAPVPLSDSQNLAPLSENSAFMRAGIQSLSLDVPKHWWLLSDAEKDNLATFSEASGATPDGQKIQVVAANATPSPAGATVRLSITKPLQFNTAELRAVSAAELKEIADDMRDGFEISLPKIGSRLVAVNSVGPEQLNGRTVMHIRYTRLDAKTGGDWQVDMYQLPTTEGLVQLTFGHRTADHMLWSTILERIKSSLIAPPSA